MIPESEISECPEHEPKSKIGNIFVNEKTLEEYSVKIYEIDPYFYEHQRKIQVNENWCKYIFFRSDIYFSGYLLAVEIDEKGHTDRDPLFEKKRKGAQEKKLGCKFVRINTDIGRIQTFFGKFKNRQLRKLEKEPNKKSKRIRRQNKKIKTSIDKLNHSIKQIVKKLLPIL